MQINVTFESLEELKDFVDWAGGTSTEIKEQVTTPIAAGQDHSHVGVQVRTVPLSDIPVSAPVQTPAPVASVPTSSATYSLDDLARAGMSLMDSGRQAELQQLLVHFGVNSLPEMPKEQYGAFATALRGLGAQI